MSCTCSSEWNEASRSSAASPMDSTLAKGLTTLEWLTRQRRECGVSEAARALGLARSNAHRTLQTLVACGFVEQNPQTSAYRPSLRLFELGTLVGAAVDVALRVRPRLAALAAETGETIHLARLDGAEVVYLDKFDSPLPVAAYSRVGGRASAACVASGKALLAAAGPGEAALRRLFGTLLAHTPNSITEFDRLAAELARTAGRGYAENREEWRLGVCGLGVPVFDARGEALVAVGMSVPSIRFGRAQAGCWPRACSSARATRAPCSAIVPARLSITTTRPARRAEHPGEESHDSHPRSPRCGPCGGSARLHRRAAGGAGPGLARQADPLRRAVSAGRRHRRDRADRAGEIPARARPADHHRQPRRRRRLARHRRRREGAFRRLHGAVHAVVAHHQSGRSIRSCPSIR